MSDSNYTVLHNKPDVKVDVRGALGILVSPLFAFGCYLLLKNLFDEDYYQYNFFWEVGVITVGALVLAFAALIIFSSSLASILYNHSDTLIYPYCEILSHKKKERYDVGLKTYVTDYFLETPGGELPCADDTFAGTIVGHTYEVTLRMGGVIAVEEISLSELAKFELT